MSEILKVVKYAHRIGKSGFKREVISVVSKECIRTGIHVCEKHPEDCEIVYRPVEDEKKEWCEYCGRYKEDCKCP